MPSLASDSEPTPSRTRIVALSPELWGATAARRQGMLWETERALGRAARRMGLEHALLVGRGAQIPAGFASDVVRVFRGPGLPCPAGASEWPVIWHHSRDFCDRVLRGLRTLGNGNHRRDVFCQMRADPGHIAGAIWLGLAMRGRCPVVLNLHALHVHYMGGDGGDLSELRWFLARTRSLRRRANVHVCVDSERLATVLERDVGERFGVLPVHSGLADGDSLELPEASRRSDGRIRLLFAAPNPRSARGIDLVTALAERLGRSDVEILARVPGETSEEIFLPSVAAVHGGLRVEVPELPRPEYQRLLRSADFVLAPYRRYRYLTQPSKTVVDAFHCGTPVVGPRDCWIGDQIEATGLGVTFEDGSIDDFVRTVRLAIDRRASFPTSGEALRRWCERNNSTALLRSVLGRDWGGTEPSHQRTTAAPLEELTHEVSVMQARITVGPALRAQRWLQGAGRVLHQARSRRRPKRGRIWLVKQHDVIPSRVRAPRSNTMSIVRWECHGVDAVEVRLDGPSGTLVGRGGPTGELWGAHYIAQGSWLFLQDASAGTSAASEHTLDRVRYYDAIWRWDDAKTDDAGEARPRWGQLDRTWRAIKRAAASAVRTTRHTAARLQGSPAPWGRLSVQLEHTSGNPMCVGLVKWESSCASVEIHADEPGGPTVGAGGSCGELTTGPWVLPTTVFYLLDADDPTLPLSRRILSHVVSRPRPSLPITALEQRLWTLFERNGSPADWGGDWHAGVRGDGADDAGQSKVKGELQILLPEACAFPAVATVVWSVSDDRPVSVRVHSPAGALFTQSKGSGQSTTGPWVTPGLRLYLVDESRPNEAEEKRFLASAVAAANALTALGIRWLTDGTAEDTADRVAMQALLGEDEWGLVPVPSAGEIYTVCKVARAFLSRFGGRRLRLFAKEPYLDICRLFPDAPIIATNWPSIDTDPQSRAQDGRLLHLWYGRIAWGPYLESGRSGHVALSFLRIYLEELGLPTPDRIDELMHPRVSDEMRARVKRQFQELGLIPGRTAILAPTANSAPCTPFSVWKRIAVALRARGFSVVTNAAPGQAVVPGTRRYLPSYAELFAAVEYGGFLVTSRSGVCEVVSEAKTRMHILRRDQVNAIVGGVTLLESVGSAGLTDRAVYHTMGLHETTLQFADRVLCHPDFN